MLQQEFRAAVVIRVDSPLVPSCASYLKFSALNTLTKAYQQDIPFFGLQKVTELTDVARTGGFVKVTYPDGIKSEPDTVTVLGSGEAFYTTLLRKYGLHPQTVERQFGLVFPLTISQEPLTMLFGVSPRLSGIELDQGLIFENTFPEYLERIFTVFDAGIRRAAQQRYPELSQRRINLLPSGKEAFTVGIAMKQTDISQPYDADTITQNIYLTATPRRAVTTVSPQSKSIELYHPPIREVVLVNQSNREVTLVDRSSGFQDFLSVLNKTHPNYPSTFGLIDRFEAFKKLQGKLRMERIGKFHTVWHLVNLPDPESDHAAFLSTLPKQDVNLFDQKLIPELFREFARHPLTGVNLSEIAKKFTVQPETVRQHHAYLMQRFGINIPPNTNDKRLSIVRATEIFALYSSFSIPEIAKLLGIGKNEVSNQLKRLRDVHAIVSTEEMVEVVRTQVRLRRSQTKLGDKALAEQFEGVTPGMVTSYVKGEQTMRQRKTRRTENEKIQILSVIVPILQDPIMSHWTNKQIEQYLAQVHKIVLEPFAFANYKYMAKQQLLEQ